MKEHLDQLKQRREYHEKIATERALREMEAEEAERIRVSIIKSVFLENVQRRRYTQERGKWPLAGEKLEK